MSGPFLAFKGKLEVTWNQYWAPPFETKPDDANITKLFKKAGTWTVYLCELVGCVVAFPAYANINGTDKYISVPVKRKE